MTPSSERPRARSALRRAGATLLAAGWAALLATIAALGAAAPLRTETWLCALALALCLQVSGAALLVLDALRDGFGALDWFFREALARSQRRAASGEPPQQADGVVRRGRLGDRPYVLYGDGAVAVETLLGPRTFASLAEAQAFIGA